MQDRSRITGALTLADGTVYVGSGVGARGIAVGELCFNTAMTGYQEILTDPSYASQIVMFTFPHVGNVGANPLDAEHSSPPAQRAAVGTVFRSPITPPSNWRAEHPFDNWLETVGIVGLSDVDTRAITKRIRELGMPRAAVAHAPDGKIDYDELVETAKAWAGLEQADLAETVDTESAFSHQDGLWTTSNAFTSTMDVRHHVIVVDFGVKKNILRNLAQAGCRATVVSGDTALDDILALKPDGVVLSNGPGDPAATIQRSGPMIKGLIESGCPILGICLGHQLLALALGAQTQKMAQGHHGANHPVLDLATGTVEIVSMNHGFTVDTATLPGGVEESHRSLFDGSNSGLSVAGRPIISVQHHPEASPGPHDSFYLFERFARLMDEATVS